MLDPRLDPEDFVAGLTDEEVEALLRPLRAIEEIERFGKFRSLFPDEGPLRRDLYPKHMEFFAAGATHRERCFMAGNRVGKTVAGAYEATCHLTGLYPSWWVGRRFRHPVRGTVAGKTNETTRDIVQAELLGEVTFNGRRKVVDGSGIIPRENIGMDDNQLTWKQGVADLVDTVRIRHVSGGWSKLFLKSYQQGRGAFEGTAMHFIWPDEEPPQDVYEEMLIRTATTKGITMLTFTPLFGLSDVVLSFLPQEMRLDGA